MKKILLIATMLLVLVTVPAFAGGCGEGGQGAPASLKAGSFAAVMGISQLNGNTVATAYNISVATVDSDKESATTSAFSSGTTLAYTYGTGDAIAAQTGAALATIGATVLATYSPFAAGSLISFGVVW